MDPLRCCVSCRQQFPRSALFWLTRDHQSGEVFLREGLVTTDKRQGRSAYVCRKPACIAAAVKGKKLQRALKCPILDDIVGILVKTTESARRDGNESQNL